MTAQMSLLQRDYPWITPKKPVIVSAPMMKISLAEYALSTSAAGGIGFLAGGFDLGPLKEDLAAVAKLLDQRDTYNHLKTACHHDGLLPIGVGVQNWGSDLGLFLEAIRQNPVRAVWFFAPKQVRDLKEWAGEVRKLVDGRIKVWVQVGTVAEAREVVSLVKPDVVVVQGADAGGHGLARRAGIISLLPEIKDMLVKEGVDVPLIAGGGIVDGRGTAAALALGAQGVCMGTRFLASTEAKIAKGYQNEVLRAVDGGTSTVGTTVYDRVRGIHGWPKEYDGRGVVNQSFFDAEDGMPDGENESLYKQEMKKGDEGWGPNGRMTTYAGTGVGLINKVSSIGDIVKEVQEEAVKILIKSAREYE